MVGQKLPGLCALGDLDLSGCAFGGWDCMVVDVDVTWELGWKLSLCIGSM